MPVHREKEVPRSRGPRREASTSRQTGERPIITQINPGRVGKVEAGKRRELAISKDAPAKKRTEKQVKSTGSHRSSERIRTRTRTLSPTEVKQLNKPKIEPEKEPEPEPASVPEPEPEQEYEDDFEEYESDFEDETSEEKEEVLKELSPEPVAKGNQREIDEIKLAMKLENEMSKSRKSISEVPAKIIKDVQVKLLDFSKTKKEHEKARKRGRDLLSMITLDTISYSFLDIPSIPYETYMKMYGRCDMKQVHVQTNEDDLNEETQTEVIEVSNKWVQKPPDIGGTKTYRMTKERAQTEILQNIEDVLSGN